MNYCLHFLLFDLVCKYMVGNTCGKREEGKKRESRKRVGEIVENKIWMCIILLGIRVSS